MKRRPEMDTNGFYGDTFSSGFGDFYTAKRSNQVLEGISNSVMDQSPFSKASKFYNTLPYGAAYQQHLVKVRQGQGSVEVKCICIHLHLSKYIHPSYWLLLKILSSNWLIEWMNL